MLNSRAICSIHFQLYYFAHVYGKSIGVLRIFPIAVPVSLSLVSWLGMWLLRLDDASLFRGWSADSSINFTSKAWPGPVRSGWVQPPVWLAVNRLKILWSPDSIHLNVFSAQVWAAPATRTPASDSQVAQRRWSVRPAMEAVKATVS